MVMAGIYLRISDDPQGRRAGVKRQEDDCRRICADRGWAVIEVYEDNDRSAYRGKARPEYRRMLEDIKSGAIDAVAAWHIDRLTRHPKDLEEFMEIADAAGIEVATATGDLDPSTGEGRFGARILGAVAAKESDDKSRRIRRKHEELARDGKNAGGGYRPFGFESDRVTIRESEARLIREAAERLLAGASMRGILKDWQAAGVTSPHGKPWPPTSFKRMILSPRIAGLREHRGEVVSQAVWPVIISEDVHRRLGRRLKTKSGGRSQRQRKYLLTGGLAVCGVCGAPLVSRPKNDGTPSMVCATGPGFTGCGKIRIIAGPFEEFVGAAVIEALSGPGLVDAMQTQATESETRDGELAEQIAQLQERLEQASHDYYVDQVISRAEFFRARDSLVDQIEQAKARLSRGSRIRVLQNLPAGADALNGLWTDADQGWRRSVVAAVIDHVEVGPAVRGRNFFDPDRLVIHWRA